jgi:hypothetical protein
MIHVSDHNALWVGCSVVGDRWQKPHLAGVSIIIRACSTAVQQYSSTAVQQYSSTAVQLIKVQYSSTADQSAVQQYSSTADQSAEWQTPSRGSWQKPPLQF